MKRKLFTFIAVIISFGCVGCSQTAVSQEDYKELIDKYEILENENVALKLQIEHFKQLEELDADGLESSYESIRPITYNELIVIPDYAEFMVTKAEHGDYIAFTDLSGIDISDNAPGGMTYICIRLKYKNLQTKTLQSYGVGEVSILYDKTYYYDGDCFSATDFAPLSDAEACFLVPFPKEILADEKSKQAILTIGNQKFSINIVY